MESQSVIQTAVLFQYFFELMIDFVLRNIEIVIFDILMTRDVMIHRAITRLWHIVFAFRVSLKSIPAVN